MFVMPTQRKSKKLYVVDSILRNTYNFFYNLSIYYIVLTSRAQTTITVLVQYAIRAKEMFVMPTQRKSKKLYVMNAILRNTYNFFYNLSIYHIVLTSRAQTTITVLVQYRWGSRASAAMC